MLKKIKIIITAIVLALVMLPMKGALAVGDTRPITTSVATIYPDDPYHLVVSVIANEDALDFASIEGMFPLIEDTAPTTTKTYFELDSLIPGPKIDASPNFVVINDVSTGIFAGAIYTAGDFISLNKGDVIWTAKYKITDVLPYEAFSFTLLINSAFFDGLPTLYNENFGFGIVVVPPKHDVPVIDGDNGVYVTDSGIKLILKFDADHTLVTDILMDGVVLSPTYYEIKAGSTIVEFAADYLNTLGIGSHTVTVNYSDGGVGVAHFTVEAAPEPVDPVDPVDPTDDVLVPNTGEFTGVGGSATAIGVGVFVGITMLPVVIAFSIERRYSRNKINFDKK